MMPTLYVSPLGRAIDRERTMIPSSTPGGGGGGEGGGGGGGGGATHHHHRRGSPPGHRRVRSTAGPPPGCAPAPPPSASSRHRRSSTLGDSVATTTTTTTLPPSSTTTGGTPPRPPGGWDDLIDVSHDEPVDPFSGLVGMPPSIVACKSDLGVGMNGIGGGGLSRLFGPSAMISSLGSFENCDDSRRQSSSMHSSGLYGGPSATERPSGVEVFDPLLVDGDTVESSSSSAQSRSMNGAAVAAGPFATTPPRHYRDDPLLAKSRYRNLWIEPGQSHQQRPSSSSSSSTAAARSVQSLPRPPQRASTWGATAVGSWIGGECMLGKIAQLEVSKMPVVINEASLMGMPRNPSSVSLVLDEGFGQPRSGHGSNDFARPATAVEKMLVAPTTPTGSSLREKTNDGGGDDDSSSLSFSEEFRLQNKGLVREVKFMLNPVIMAGQKLLRRKSESAALKRADGCLT